MTSSAPSPEPLLVADLLPFAPATLDSYLETTFAEYARQAREEFP